MKTNDLIKLLAEDAPVRMRLGRMLTVALCAGLVISAIILIGSVGIRPDIASALETARVLLKISVTLLFAAAASSVVFRIGRPGVPVKMQLLAMLVPVLLLVVAVLLELSVLPKETWAQNMRGEHAMFCMIFVPVLSLAPLAGFMLALKSGAPDNPGLAGATAGLAAGGLAAALYAWHCPDDSPLFVATWYPLAIFVVTAAGFALGRRLLRW